MKSFRLDPENFPRIRRNIILTYIILALVALVIFYLYLREALFNQAWMLIPFVLLVFTAAGWYALRQRRKYWEGYELRLGDNILIRAAPNNPDMKIKRKDVTGIKEVHQGLILATRASENALLIPKELSDQDYQQIKGVMERWASKKA
jgi:hypothetical protein